LETNRSSLRESLRQACAKADAYVEQVLYWTVGICLYLNALSLLSGNWIALLSIAIQALVVASIYFRKSWAYIVVGIWAVMGILSGATFWLAVLLRGGEIVQPVHVIVTSNLSLVMGIYFYRNVKTIRYRNQKPASVQADANT